MGLINEFSTGKSNPGRGGKRAGAGRKTKVATILRKTLAQVKAESAEFAFHLFDETLHDTGQPIDLRLDCGREVMNRVWGKPAQKIEHDFTDLSDAELVARAKGVALGVGSPGLDAVG